MLVRFLCASLFASLALAPPAASQVTLTAADISALRHDLAVSDLSLQELSLPAQPGAPFAVQVTLDGAPMRLLLSPYSMRSDDFQLLVQVEGGALVPQQPAPPATYRGTVEGVPGSVVSGSLIDGQLSALVRIARGLPVYGVQPAGATAAVAVHAGRSLHAVYSSDDRLLLDAGCGTDTSGPFVPEAPASGPGDSGDAGEKVCEIACDADVEFYVKNQSSVTSTQNDIENVLNNVEAIYQADVGILYTTTTILVRTVESDPYSSTTPSTLLNQFSGHWNGSQGAIPRDVAHLFTGKSLSGSVIGIAQLNVICNKSAAYGLSESKWTGSMLYRAALTAHEVGHNWAAQHCDGMGDCSIMCSGLGGCTGDVNSFGVSEKNQINNKKNSVTCLSDAGPPVPPTISSLSPTSVAAFEPGVVTINGSGLGATTKVTVGGVEVNSLNGLLTVAAGKVTFSPPAPTSLGSKTVTVTTTGGTASAPNLTFTETSPPKLTVEFLAFTGEPYLWSYGAGANDAAWLVVAVDPTTVIYKGNEMLTNYLIVWAGTLNAAGVGSLTATVPAAAAGLSFLSQLFTFNPTVPSPIRGTWVIY
jgi:hypothetical protein